MSKRDPGIVYEKMCLNCRKFLVGRQRSWCSHICEVAIWQKKNRQKVNRYKEDYKRNHPDRRRATTQKYDLSERGKKKRREWNKLNQRWLRQVKVIATQKRRGKSLGLTEHFTLTEWLELKKKYEFTCLCCGKKEPDIILTVDHIIPLAAGGLNKIENIQPLCGTCNRKKRRQETDYRE